MTSFQLSSLRSKINAVLAHFGNGENFRDALLALLKLYSRGNQTSHYWKKNLPKFEMLNVPEAAMAEIETGLRLMAKTESKYALTNADLLWDSDYFECKLLAFYLLSSLDPIYREKVKTRIHGWISADLDPQLLKGLFDAFENHPDFFIDEYWVKLLSAWFSSADDEIVRIGLSAMRQMVSGGYNNIPRTFNLLSIVMQNPRISIQKDLLNILQQMIKVSEAETASFLMMCLTLQSSKEVNSFVRKCLPLFDPFFQNEIKSVFRK